MKKILFATGNTAKLKRFSKGLLENNIEILSLADVNVNIELEENGKDAIENALIKARAFYNATKITTMAMDDNLYLENIPEDLQPGMFVRRVNGKRLNDEEMISYYSSLAKRYGEKGKIAAKWIYGLAIINEGVEKTYTWNNEEFFIVDTPSGIINSGYPLDSISINKKLGKYFTDMTDEDKKNIKQNETNVIDFIVKNV